MINRRQASLHGPHLGKSPWQDRSAAPDVLHLSEPLGRKPDLEACSVLPHNVQVVLEVVQLPRSSVRPPLPENFAGAVDLSLRCHVAECRHGLTYRKERSADAAAARARFPEPAQYPHYGTIVSSTHAGVP